MNTLLSQITFTLTNVNIYNWLCRIRTGGDKDHFVEVDKMVGTLRYIAMKSGVKMEKDLQQGYEERYTWFIDILGFSEAITNPEHKIYIRSVDYFNFILTEMEKPTKKNLLRCP